MRLRLFACISPVLLAACGSLPDDPSEPDALATLEGQLTNQSALPLEGDVRIAVIWRRPTPEGTVSYSVAEDVPVEPVFPSKFRVVLRTPPPEEAMVAANDVFEGEPDPGNPEIYPVGRPEPAPGVRASALRAQEADYPADLRVATGTLVAYVDENGNGRLDLVDEGAPGFLDRVVATNDGLLLAYFEGTIPSPFAGFEAPPAPGYNFLVDTCAGSDGPVSSDDPPVQGEPCVGFQASSTDKPFALPVTSDPNLSDLMCKNGGGLDGGSVGGAPPLPDPSVQPAQYPAPNDPTLQCAQDGSSYRIHVCETYSEGLCKGVITECKTLEQYARPTPTPAGWPCPSPLAHMAEGLPHKPDVAALYGRYGFLLRRRCLLILRDEALADDALQDAFVRLLRQGAELAESERPLRLLYRVVDTTCFDHLRRRKVRRVEGPSPDDPVGAHPDVRLEIRDGVLRLLGSLEGADLRIAMLAFVDGMTQGEIADEVGLSRVTVNKRVESLRARAASIFQAQRPISERTLP